MQSVFFFFPFSIFFLFFSFSIARFVIDEVTLAAVKAVTSRRAKTDHERTPEQEVASHQSLAAIRTGEGPAARAFERERGPLRTIREEEGRLLRAHSPLVTELNASTSRSRAHRDSCLETTIGSNLNYE